MTTKSVDQFNLPLTIRQGEDETFTFLLETSAGVAVNITGYTAKLQVRAKPSSLDTLVSLSSAGGNITNGGSNGTFTATIAKSATALYTWESGWWDFRVTDNSAKDSFWCGGPATCLHTVSR